MSAGSRRRVLVLDGADGEHGPRWALLEAEPDGVVIHECRAGSAAGRDGAGLAGMLRGALDALGWRMDATMLLAVVTGPGSFTGLRATLALAHGLAAGSGAELRGVSAGAAMLPELAAAPRPAGDLVWWVSRARRDRVFLEDRDGVRSVALDRLPVPSGGRVVLGGNGAAAVAAVLGPAARMVAGMERVTAAAVARAALRDSARDSARGETAGPVLPLYVDAPEAVPMAGRVA